MPKRAKRRPKQNGQFSNKRTQARIQALKEALARWDELIEKTEGSRKFSYMIRRDQILMMIKAKKRSLRDKKYKNGATPYVVDSKGVQGGAPGLIQQR